MSEIVSGQLKRLLCLVVSPFVAMQERECSRTVISFLSLFFIMVSYYMLKPVRSSLLLTDLGSDYLPSVLLVQAFLTFFFSAIYNWVSQRFSKKILMRVIFLGSMLLIAGFWIMLNYGIANTILVTGKVRISTIYSLPGAIAFNLYLFVSIYILFIQAVFWSLNHDIFSAAEACRLFGLILLGASIGQFVGGELTRVLTPLIGTFHLVLVAGALLGLAYLIVEVLASFPEKMRKLTLQDIGEKLGVIENLKTLYRVPHTGWIAALVLLAALSINLLNFQYQKMVELSISGRDLITIHFGFFFKSIAILNIILLLFFSSRIVKRIGPSATMFFLPLLCFMLNLYFSFGDSLQVAVIFAVVTMSFNYTLYNMGKEILYIPLNQSTRYQMKSFIDAFGFRLGSAIAAIIQLILLKFFPNSAGMFSRVIVFLYIMLWVPVIFRAERSYNSINHEVVTKE